MSRGFTSRHAQMAGDLGFAVKFKATIHWMDCLQINNS